MTEKTERILVECKSCDATGKYRGFMEARGQPVTCNRCDGIGAITETIFTGKREFIDRDVGK